MASEDTERLTERDAITGPDSNPDPITGAPGSHPIGTGVGAATVNRTGGANCFEPHATANSVCGPGLRSAGFGTPFTSPARQNGAPASVRLNTPSR